MYKEYGSKEEKKLTLKIKWLRIKIRSKVGGNYD